MIFQPDDYMRNIIKGKRYHCSNISEAEWDRRVHGTLDRFSAHVWTLCGLDVAGRSWDFPSTFATSTISYSGLPRGKKCLNSPQLPLLLLGEL